MREEGGQNPTGARSSIGIPQVERPAFNRRISMFKLLVAAAGLAACFSVQAEQYVFSAVEPGGTPVTLNVDLPRLVNDPDSPFLPEVSTLADGTIVHTFDTAVRPTFFQVYWWIQRQDPLPGLSGGAEFDRVIVESMLRPDQTTALRIRNDFYAHEGHTERSGFLDVSFVCDCRDLYVSELSLNLLDQAHLSAGSAYTDVTTYGDAGLPYRQETGVVFAAVPEPDELVLVLAGLGLLVVSGAPWRRTSLAAAPSGSARSRTASGPWPWSR